MIFENTFSSPSQIYQSAQNQAKGFLEANQTETHTDNVIPTGNIKCVKPIGQLIKANWDASV